MVSLPPAPAAGGSTAGLILVLNVGSSSLKACLFDPLGRKRWQGQHRLGGSGGELDAADPWPAAMAWLEAALAPWPAPWALAAHRVVHGGERFAAPTAVDKDVEQALEALIPLAPLHNGPALALIRQLRARWPTLPQWACFDTAFHSTLPAEAFTYALPAAWRAHGRRRFGFHGLNHQHVSEVSAERLGWPAELRLISCHLGAGCSLAAIRSGRCLDTSMGFTPLEGLVMATRSGSVDPGLLLQLLRDGVGVEELEHNLQRRSGLLGLSELSGDMRVLRQAAAAGHGGARLALAVFRHRLVQGIGAMAASLGGVDAITLSGGIGENDTILLEELKTALRWMGPVTWLQVPADEEGMIARLCRRALSPDPADRESGEATG